MVPINYLVKLIDLMKALDYLIDMKINNIGLSAFYQCALKQSMTEAAMVLGVTQSALSQRITALEADLETTLFNRVGKTLNLTSRGQELMEYCHYQSSLEEEILAKLKGNNNILAGTIRIGAYSSIIRSLILPQLSHLLRAHPHVLSELKSYEVGELLEVLKSNQAELVVADFHFNKPGVSELVIGKEQYVVIESTKYKTENDVYLDHDVRDTITKEFFAKQASRKKLFSRSFMGDVYAIIDAVELGLGRAVMSRHLIEGNKKVRIVSDFKTMDKPIVMHYIERPYYSLLFKQTLEVFKSR